MPEDPNTYNVWIINSDHCYNPSTLGFVALFVWCFFRFLFIVVPNIANLLFPFCHLFVFHTRSELFDLVSFLSGPAEQGEASSSSPRLMMSNVSGPCHQDRWLKKERKGDGGATLHFRCYDFSAAVDDALPIRHFKKNSIIFQPSLKRSLSMWRLSMTPSSSLPGVDSKVIHRSTAIIKEETQRMTSGLKG